MKLTSRHDFLLRAVALLACLLTASQALCAWIPPLTMAELCRAEIIVVGHFETAEGKMHFHLDRMVKGDESAARAQMLKLVTDNRVHPQPDGGLIFNRPRSQWGFGVRVDAKQPGLWFFLGSKSGNEVDWQPAALADGFEALTQQQEPDAFFRILQQVDMGMQRDAMEELYAQREPKLVARLHNIALSQDASLAAAAFNALVATKLVEPDQFWEKWTSLPIMELAAGLLAKENRDRMMQELKKAIASEKKPERLDMLLSAIPHDSHENVDLALPFLGHESASVRRRAIGKLSDEFWRLNTKRSTAPDLESQLTALGERTIPLLETRLKVETDPGCKQVLNRMLERADGVPWILRIPREEVDPPIPAYSEDEEMEFLVNRLTSHNDHGFIMETAGQEIAKVFFEEGFKRLKAAAAATNIYNTDLVYEGMGYVRDPRMFEHLVEHLAEIGPGDSTYGSTFRAIGVQNNPGSLAAIKRFSQEVNEHNERQLDGLAVLDGAEVLAYLKEHEKEIKYHAQIPYLRALAMHGDSWAVDELLSTLQDPPAPKFLTDGYWIPSYILDALLSVDTPEATAALKKEVEKTCPSTSSPDSFLFHWAYLENYAGSSHRGTAFAEIARRDPHWLVALCLRKMADKSLPARSHAASAFQQLTGQLGDYRPEAFAADRIEPLKKLETWWDEHKAESREQWLAHYFLNKGFRFTKLDKTALAALVQALESDFFTHNLAVEQISVICRKYFDDFQHQDTSFQGQRRMNVRVIGWLKARQWID